MAIIDPEDAFEAVVSATRGAIEFLRPALQAGDDWPTLIVACDERSQVVVGQGIGEAIEAGTEMLDRALAMLRVEMRSCIAAALVMPTWTVSGDDLVEGMEPEHHPRRRESLLMIAAARNGRRYAQDVPVLRHDGMTPDLGEWGVDTVPEGALIEALARMVR